MKGNEKILNSAESVLQPKIIELGGGANAVYRPNIDIASLPGVDIVHDIAKGIPFDDNCLDLIYSRDFIEHLTFTEFIYVLGECKRVLCEEGKIEFIVPDVYKALFTWTKWNEHTHHMVIGDHNVLVTDWDSCSLALRHKMWFTPELLRYILDKEGWVNIEISEYKKDAEFWREPKTRVVAEK